MSCSNTYRLIFVYLFNNLFKFLYNLKINKERLPTKDPNERNSSVNPKTKQIANPVSLSFQERVGKQDSSFSELFLK